MRSGLIDAVRLGYARMVPAHRASTLAAMLGAFATGCCLTGGWHECDSESYVATCEGSHYTMCRRTSGVWTGEIEELVEGDCVAGEVCIQEDRGAGCVLSPGVPCDPATHTGRCDGAFPVLCSQPGDWTETPYEVRGSECVGSYACGMEGPSASCMPAGGVPCPYPPPSPMGCDGNDLVFCSPGADGRFVQGMRLPCGAAGCEEDANGLGHCR